MPRPFSVRRPTLEAYAKAVARIVARQRRDEEKVDLFLKTMDEDDPRHQAILKELEDRAALTEREEQTLLNAATVAAKLERVADKSEEDEKVSPEKRKAALEALERGLPQKPRSEDAEDAEDEEAH